ncbi:hypothetical protein Tco_0295578 [Tanacetum coccineum]
MAAPGPTNMVARRVTDDLIAFIGETAPPRYMKFFLTQKLAESHRFVNCMREEAETLNEEHDSLLAAKDAKRSEQSKLVALNDVIAEALEEFETQEANVEILDGGNDVPLFNELRFVKVRRPADVVVGSVVVFVGVVYIPTFDGNGLIWFVLGVCRLCPYGCGVRQMGKLCCAAEYGICHAQFVRVYTYVIVVIYVEVMSIWIWSAANGNGALGVWVADNAFQNLVCLEVAQLNMVSVMHSLSQCTPKSPLSFMQRRAIDELAEFSRETDIPKSTKFFKLQQISEAKHFINAMYDPDEVYDSLKCLREDMLAENDKLMGLNEFVANAEEDTDMKEVIGRSIGEDYRLGRAINCALLELYVAKDRETVANLQILVREMELNASKKELFIQKLKGLMPLSINLFTGYVVYFSMVLSDKLKVLMLLRLIRYFVATELTEQAESTYLKDKMKFWFTRASTGDQASSYAIMLLNHIREIVGRESVKLAVIEQLSGSTDVAMRLKDGYVTDME